MQTWWKRCGAAALAIACAAGCGNGLADQSKSRGTVPEVVSTTSPSALPTKSTEPVSDAKALTLAQLKSVAFADNEQVGTDEAYRPDDLPFSEEYGAKPEVCKPLTSLGESAVDPDPAAEFYVKVSDPDSLTALSTDVILRSYDGDGAAKIMQALKAAGDECASGYIEDRALAEAKVLEVKTLEPPAYGDEAVAYRLVVLDVKGKEKLCEYLTVIRAGTTTLSFRSEILDTKDFGGVPQAIIDAQWQKFETTID